METSNQFAIARETFVEVSFIRQAFLCIFLLDSVGFHQSHISFRITSSLFFTKDLAV